MHTEEGSVEGFASFEIRHSENGTGKSAVVSPDMAICDNCLREMRDPSDRRHGYWLINCTDCGPRYTITQTVPYDRPNTSMARFGMCPSCESEYNDPRDRRYHAQPISCHLCGPTLTYQAEESASGEEALQHAVAALKSGKIIAVKGLGGFHLMCDATNEASVLQLRERKRRPTKPFAVMFPSIDAIIAECPMTGAERELVDSKEKPVVLVRKQGDRVAVSVAPGIDRLGVFLPYTPLHHRLFETIDFPLVATSANLSDEPIIRTDAELADKLSEVVDGVLTHDREIVNACDDSVMQLLGRQPLMLRLARGFAPMTLSLPFRTAQRILAVGANQKSSIALAFEDRVLLSPHIGDLGSLEANAYFERTLETFKRFYDFEPDMIVCDKHPGYETTKWAKAQKRPLLEVQHHYAHLLAALAEMRCEEQVLGFMFDGTGYGDDGTIWGGEVLLGDVHGYERLFSLRPFRLLGGEKAVREPWRVALGVLFECYSLDEVLAMELPLSDVADPSRIRMLHAAWTKGINAPVTSSMGRLFDAVSSLAGIVQHVSYEGESGLKLEGMAKNVGEAEPYPFTLQEGVIDWQPLITGIVQEPENAASRFIATVAMIIVEIARRYDRKVVCSGGVFQNRTLLEHLLKRFDEAGIDGFIPSRFPVNDGAVALGQLWHALHLARKP